MKKHTILMSKLFSNSISNEFKKSFAEACKQARDKGYAEFDNDGSSVYLVKDDDDNIVAADSDSGEFTVVKEDDGKFSLNAYSIPEDNIKENLDGSNMNPEFKLDENLGVIDSAKAGTDSQKEFTEPEDNEPEDAKVKTEVEVTEVKPDEEYEVVTKDYSVNLKCNLEKALLFSAKFGKINLKLFSDSIPEVNIKENLEGSNMNPESKINDNLGVKDPAKAGTDSQKEFTDPETKPEDVKPEDTKPEDKDDDLKNQEAELNKLESSIDELAKEDLSSKSEDELNDRKATAEELMDKVDEIDDSVEDKTEVKSKCKTYSDKLNKAIDELSKIKIYSNVEESFKENSNTKLFSGKFSELSSLEKCLLS